MRTRKPETEVVAVAEIVGLDILQRDFELMGPVD